jgi:hypothetical protein
VVVTLHAALQDPISFRDLFFRSVTLFSLRSIENYVLQLDPYLMSKIMDLMIYILSPIISLEDFDLLSRLCLNQCFEIFEVLKDLGFLPEKVDPSKT